MPNSEEKSIRIKNYVPPMMKPGRPIYLSGKEFWSLINEGWRFFIGEDGRVLGYVPATLSQVLENRMDKERENY